MQYIRCIVSRPGLLENITLNFNEKVIIISGKNGSGKSLIARGLIDGIWKNFCNRGLLNEETWDNLFFDIQFNLAGNERYQFINNCRKSFTARLLNKKDEDFIFLDNIAGNNSAVLNISDYNSPALLKNFFDRIDPDAFINLTFIPSPSDLDINNLIDYKKIQKVTGIDNTGFNSIKDSISKLLFSEKGAKISIDAEIDACEKKLKDINRKIQIIDIQNNRIVKLKRERDLINGEIEKLNRDLQSLKSENEILKKILKNIPRVEKSNRDILRINKEVEDEYKRREAISNIKRELNKLFPQFADFNSNDKNYLDKLQEIFYEIRNLNEKIENLHYAREKLKEKFKRAGIAVNISAAALIISILYKNGFKIENDQFILTGIFGISLIITLILILASIVMARQKKFAEFNEEKKKLENTLKEVLEQSNVELKGYKLGELYEFLLQYFDDFIEFSDRSSELNSLESGLKDKKLLKKKESELNILKKIDSEIKEEINRDIEKLNYRNGIELNHVKLKELIARNDVEIRNKNKEAELKNDILKKIDIDIDFTREENEETEKLFAEEKNIREKLNRLNSFKNSINFIYEIYNEAAARCEEKQLNRLVNETYGIFNFLTDNQFVTKLERNDIKRLLLKNKIPDEFNTTILHFLIISIKIALTDFLTEAGLVLPLIFDDPFLFMDDERSERFKEIISKISGKRQVIILTHLKDKGNWGHYIEL